MKRFWLPILLCSCAEFLCAVSLEQLPLSSFAPGADTPIAINADHMSADSRQGTVELKGNVQLRFSDVTVSADRATLNRDTGWVTAEGSVMIGSLSAGSWRGDSISFNHKTGEGLFSQGVLNANVQNGSVTILSDGYTRDEKGVFHSGNISLTTCTNASHAWHWHMTGSGSYKHKEFFELNDVVPHFLGIPFFWMPYYYRDLNTHYGVRFMPGYSSKFGAYVRMGYVYPLVGVTDDPFFLYGKTYVDLRTKRGQGVGQELTWGTDTFNQWGRLSLYYAYDNDNKVDDLHAYNWQTSWESHRWSAKLVERLDFTPSDSFRLMSEYVSDAQFRYDYQETSLRDFSQPITIAFYEHRALAWSAGILGSGSLNSFYGGTRRLPELWLSSHAQEFFGIDKLYYESKTTGGWYDRRPAKFEDAIDIHYRWQLGNWSYYKAARFDTRQTLRRPFTLVDGVTFTPRASARFTGYSESADADRNKEGELYRVYGEVGAELKFRFYSDFSQDWRHVLLPYIDWSYVPDISTSDDRTPYAFDQVERSYEWRDQFGIDGFAPPREYNGFKFGFRNLFQKRKDGVRSTVLDFDAYGICVMDDEDETWRYYHRDQIGDGFPHPLRTDKHETGLRVLGFDTAYTPTRDFALNTTLEYDPHEDQMAFLDIHARYMLSSVTLYTGFLYRDHSIYDYYWRDRVKDSVVYGGFIHEINDTLSWSGYIRYNTEATDLEEIGGFLQYNLDCLSFRFNLGFLPETTAEDGYVQDDDFRFSFTFFLRAFPQRDIPEWTTWGNLQVENELGR